MIHIAVAVLFVVHGLIHLLGFAKGVGHVDLPQLTEPVSPAMGLLWLAAGLLRGAATAALFLAPRWWWAVGAVALVMSQAVIVTSWSDAKRGPGQQRSCHRGRSRDLAGPEKRYLGAAVLPAIEGARVPGHMDRPDHAVSRAENG